MVLTALEIALLIEEVELRLEELITAPDADNRNFEVDTIVQTTGLCRAQIIDVFKRWDHNFFGVFVRGRCGYVSRFYFASERFSHDLTPATRKKLDTLAEILSLPTGDLKLVA